MQISNTPLKFYVPFATNDSSKVEIPVTTSDPTRASQSLGFPPNTGLPPESGGVPPQLEDFNGAINQIARTSWWLMAGAPYVYDSTFATNSNINGYAQGAELRSADYLGSWICTADNNQVNPDTVGTNWVPGLSYGNTAIAGLTNANVTLTPAQASKRTITLSGTLTGNINIVAPNWVYSWDVTNNTTGAFTITFKTAAGSGVVIPQDASPTRVSGDGTNIYQAAANVAAATAATHPVQLGQLQQTYAWNHGFQTFSTTTTTTVPANVYFMRYKIWAGGGGGGGAGASGQSAGGGGGGEFAEGVMAVTPGATITATIGAAGTAGGAGGSGGAGGTTTLTIGSTTITCVGGGGGAPGVSGAGGSAGTGGTGTAGRRIAGTGGATGSNAGGGLGGGGGAAASSAGGLSGGIGIGGPGMFPGGGGAGIGGAASGSGAAGGAGQIVLEW